MIELCDVKAGYGKRQVLNGVNLTFQAGEVLVLVGPNGSGKSTLLRTALGLVPCMEGSVLYNGVNLKNMTPKQVACQAAFLAQSRTVLNITAQRMVLHGRFPHLSYPRHYGAKDYEIVQRALEAVDGAELAPRLLKKLSGGQRQKVYLAMAIAQQTPTVLMDEPTTFLDIAHQLGVMQLSRRLAQEGKAVVMVLHDLSLALRYADRLAVLDHGQLISVGCPEDIYQSGVLEQVFHIRQGRAGSDGGWHYFCTLGEGNM